jgi:hypothetical protein
MTESNEELAQRLSESSGPFPEPLSVRTGSDAAAAGREFLLREFGDEQSIEAAMRKPGRPSKKSSPTGAVTANAGASPTVRGRVPLADYRRLQEVEKKSGKTESELVREGIALVIARYA